MYSLLCIYDSAQIKLGRIHVYNVELNYNIIFPSKYKSFFKDCFNPILSTGDFVDSVFFSLHFSLIFFSFIF